MKRSSWSIHVKLHIAIAAGLLLLLLAVPTQVQAQNAQTERAATQLADQPRVLEAVQLYTDGDLVAMIRNNTHLQRVRDIDDCQLYQDIEAQATIERRPVYQLLYGDMLAYAVCYDRNVELGVTYMQHAADQGMPEALEQLGRYYHQGRLVQQDLDRALLYLREAAALGSLPARKRFAELLLSGHGSPLDYEAAYHFLHNSVTADRTEYQTIERLLAQLAERLPPRIVERARSPIDS